MTAHRQGLAGVQVTMETMLDRIRSDERLSLKQRQDRIAATTSVCKWLQRAPVEVPADPGWLRIAFGRLTPAAVGVSVGRFANVRSLLNALLRDHGLLQGRDHSALAPQWQALIDRIEPPQARAGITRLVRFLSVQGVAPEAVDDAAVARYQAYLGKNDFRADAYKVTQATVRGWNRLVDRGWPLPRLTPLKKFERYTVNWDRVPASLRQTIEHWLSVCAGAHPLDDLTPPRALRPETVKARRFLLLQLISGMHHRGIEVSGLTSLADICEPARVKEALRYHYERYRQRHPDSTGDVRTPTLFGIVDLARQIAKYHVGADPDVVQALTDLARRFRPNPSGMSETAERRLQQIENPKVLRALLRDPLLEMHKLLAKPEPHRRDASRFAKLLAVALLPRAPLRIKNLAALDLDQHLKVPSRPTEPILVSIPRDGVKNAQPMKFRIEDRLAVLFRAYLRHFRPLLLRQPSSAVFPGKSGGPKDRKLFGRQISGLLRREFGLEWNPHLFRHLVAYLFRAHGGSHADTQLALGHRNGDTTRRNYEGFDARFAFEKLDRMIDDLAGPLPPRPRMRSSEREV